MAAFWMCRLLPSEVAGSDALAAACVVESKSKTIRKKPPANTGVVPARHRARAWRRIMRLNNPRWKRQETGGWSC